MLKAIPKNLLTWNSDILENNIPVGSLEFPSWKKTGKIISQGGEYRVRQKGVFTGNFFLDNYDFRLGYGKQRNHLCRIIDLTYGQNKYQLKAVSSFSKKFILQKHQKTLGAIYPKNILERQAIIELPANLPLDLRLFAGWIVMWFWRQSQRNL